MKKWNEKGWVELLTPLILVLVIILAVIFMLGLVFTWRQIIAVLLVGGGVYVFASTRVALPILAKITAGTLLVVLGVLVFFAILTM